jgi:hypothetical protein
VIQENYGSADKPLNLGFKSSPERTDDVPYESAGRKCVTLKCRAVESSAKHVSGPREKALETLPHRTTKTSYLTYESFLSSTIFPMHCTPLSQSYFLAEVSMVGAITK